MWYIELSSHNGRGLSEEIVGTAYSNFCTVESSFSPNSVSVPKIKANNDYFVFKSERRRMGESCWFILEAYF